MGDGATTETRQAPATKTATKRSVSHAETPDACQTSEG